MSQVEYGVTVLPESGEQRVTVLPESGEQRVTVLPESGEHGSMAVTPINDPLKSTLHRPLTLAAVTDETAAQCCSLCCVQDPLGRRLEQRASPP